MGHNKKAKFSIHFLNIDIFIIFIIRGTYFHIALKFIRYIKSTFFKDLL